MAQSKPHKVPVTWFTELELGKVFARMEDDGEPTSEIALKFLFHDPYVKRLIREWRAERALWRKK